MPSRTHEESYPGAHARSPGRIPARGWRQILVRALRRTDADRVPLMAAGVAFFAFLALFPSLIAAVLVYGLVTTRDDMDEQVESLAGVLPTAAVQLVARQMETLAAADQQGLSIGLVVSLLFALWSASIGVGHLITAVHVAYEEREEGSLLQRLGKTLVFTLAGAVVFFVVVGLVAVFPAVVDAAGVDGVLLGLVRWAVLLLVFALTLGAVYRYAPSRTNARVGWVSVGAVVATALWLAVSAAFSLYVAHVGRYAETYGALAGVAIGMSWLWLSCLAVMLGAEINAEAEHQTDADSTVGPDKPRGERGAVKADTAIGRPPETRAPAVPTPDARPPATPEG